VSRNCVRTIRNQRRQGTHSVQEQVQNKSWARTELQEQEVRQEKYYYRELLGTGPTNGQEKEQVKTRNM
jgi:hypothetical protein